MVRRRLFLSGVAGLVLLALGVGLAGGILLGSQVLPHMEPRVQVPPSAAAEFELIAEAWEVIEREYVYQDGVEPRRMAHGALSGMVQTLGDVGHTRFLGPEMAARHRQQLEGRFEGIGAYVEMRDGRVVIVAPIDGTPADRGGLKAGDIILEVNGEDVTGLSLTEVVDRVVGPAGTTVSLTIRDSDTEKTRKVTMERARIELDVVTWERLPGTKVGYVRISAFSEGAAGDLREALTQIERAEEINGLILDLRNNPGGLLGEGVAAASQFLDSGDVLLRRDADGKTVPEAVQEDARTVEMPIVVLANGGTASAAEIVTGALQDHERAPVVGTTTFGAGTVLNEFALSDGSVLLLAVEEWLTPKGRVIWQKGLAPDVEVALPADAGLLRLRRRDISEEELRDSGDSQLLRALELLEGNENQ